MRSLLAGGLLLALASSVATAQRNLSGTAQLQLALEKLPVTGSVLMIGAHPDDENTALLAYFARGRKLRTAYLSLTRGEGGQNLIGSEQGALIGLIRTQELLAARRIDGAEQYFSRAIDFGFSKTADETFQKWGREQTLSDVVWVIRKFQPDIIVNRFSGTPRDGHGNHQASALLSKEAFRAAADPKRFPEQLQYVQPWQAKRLFFNVFAFTAEQERAAAKEPGRLMIDTGDYDPRLGYSFTEIAGMSRSMHRSQAMGSSERKGSVPNYLLLLEGPPAGSDPLEEIDTTWKRVPGGAAVGELLTRAARDFTPAEPAKTIPALLEARRKLAALKDPIAARKLEELDEAIALASGLWLDAVADRYAAVPGGSLKVTLTALNRSTYPWKLTGYELQGAVQKHGEPSTAHDLAYNRPVTEALPLTVPANQPYSQPYWLVKPHSPTRYTVDDQTLVGRPENPPVLSARFTLRAGDQVMTLTRPVTYRYVDPADGELIRPLTVVPPVALDMEEKVRLFPNTSARSVEVLVTANVPSQSGEVRLRVPQGWQVSPASRSFSFQKEGEKAGVAFTVTPPANDSTAELRAEAAIGGATISAGTLTIQYPHIPPQTIFPPPQTALIREDVKVRAKRVGYIMGAGDEMPDALRELGCEVTMLDADALATGDLARFDAVVTGVRAYNVRADLRANQTRLLEYVKQGGTLVQQYNVLEGGFGGGNPRHTENMGPYPFRISRERVTVEEAPVTFPNPQLAVLHQPNEIAAKDFEGWVQERGLYFPTQWDSRYQTVFSSGDPGEPLLPGGTLYAGYGKGAYIYTAYAWFRELPAGVPGSYRIFANLLSAKPQ